MVASTANHLPGIDRQTDLPTPRRGFCLRVDLSATARIYHEREGVGPSKVSWPWRGVCARYQCELLCSLYHATYGITI